MKRDQTTMWCSASPVDRLCECHSPNEDTRVSEQRTRSTVLTNGNRWIWFWYHYVSVLFCALLLLHPAVSQSRHLAVYPENEDLIMNHFVRDEDTENIYLGVVNSIRQLDNDLNLTKLDTTGPHYDNPECIQPFNYPDCTEFEFGSNVQVTEMPNYNKLLMIIPGGKLLTCGSLFQGTCKLRELTDIGSYTWYTSDANHYVSDNHKDGTVVGFVAPGKDNQDVLYVASSKTHAPGNIRGTVPHISSRRLTGDDQQMLQLVFSDDQEGTLIKQVIVEDTDIKYMAGFSIDNYSYFFTRQPDATNLQNVVSKVVQICHEDDYYRSYIDIIISCTDGSNLYDQIQTAQRVTIGSEVKIVATFESDNYPGSALCVYGLNDLRDAFNMSLTKCNQDQQGPLAWPFQTISHNCDFPLPTDKVLHCGLIYSAINSPLSGIVPVQANKIHLFNSIVTSLAFDEVQGSLIGFFGTAKGFLIKAMINTSTVDVFDNEYEDRYDGQPVKEIDVLQGGEAMYVLTEKKLYKTEVTDCSIHADCETCLGARNPYCGWCTLENRCEQKRSCTSSSKTMRWYNYTEKSISVCPKLGNDQPTTTKISISNSIDMELLVENLPDPGEYEYVCVFVSQDPSFSIPMRTITEIQQDPTLTLITCQTPVDENLPPMESDNISATLHLRSKETDASLFEREVMFYDCSKKTTCIACTSSDFPCDWCVHDDKCVDNDTSCIVNVRVNDDKSRLCPIISTDLDVLIPAGAKSFTITAKNIPEILPGMEGFQCELTGDLAPTTVTVSAEAVGDGFECGRDEDNEYTYSEKSRMVEVRVKWNENVYMGKASKGEIYNCDIMGPDCTSCTAMKDDASLKKYNCHYCQSECSAVPCPSSTDECPEAVVTNVSPLSSPLEGGTILTIEGKDLGKDSSDVSVTVVGRACEVMGDHSSTSVSCITSRSSTKVEGPVVFSLRSSGVDIEAPQMFSYKNPNVTDFKPKTGPMAGGTILTITGQDLNTGSHQIITLVFTDKRKCSCDITGSDTQITDTQITCRTESCGQGPVSVQIYYNDARSLRPNPQYIFQENPNVTDYDPKEAFMGGGRRITIDGHWLNGTKTPRLHLKGNNVENSSLCTYVSVERLECAAPTMDSAGIGLFNATILYDKHVLRLGSMQIYENPKFDPLTDDGSVYDYPGNNLQLTGENLMEAADKDDYVVMIGPHKCAVDILNDGVLYCIPPDNEEFKDGESDETFDVIVTVGNLRMRVGQLRFPSGDRNFTVLFIVLAVIFGVLFTTIIIIVVAYKRKSSEALRQYKNLQMQLDTLESNVRNECKQAFAELQTEVSDFTSDINVIGIPFWDYRSYTFKVLFPSHKDHPILHNSPEYNTTKFGSYDQGLHQFSQLLNSKHFLLIFIRTLEQQKNFSIRDKAVVASLLMVVLQDKMEYATDILKSLLNELIDRSVEKKHPKLMLRRTESVVEKLLTNWLSLSMYGYLKKHTGKALFMLYQAIKHQTEKGVVDGITSEARYSLSEDRLLREKIDANTLTLYLETDDGREPTVCKALDQDTVTQAKEKCLDAIYMNTPFSRRPSVYDVDLEWRSGKSGHLPLQDEDVTTNSDNGWKKCNSLAHYHVVDGATMALVPKKNKNDQIHNVHGMVEITGGSLSRITPILTMEEGTKVWHLVKHDDTLYTREKKVISEIFLTRLLATKGTLQQYIDDLFMNILKVDNTLPPAVKYLFDFLDTAARRHNIVDPEVVQTWKSNSLPLRFWVNIIKNPEFIFDIHKSNIIDSCLSVVAQTFMDSCSTSELKLGKDSPSNKLLFAKDIPRYRQWVSRFYKGINQMQPVTDQEITQIMTELSMTRQVDFNVSVALKELYKYALQYNYELIEALDSDPSAKKMHLPAKFEQVMTVIEGHPMY